MKAIFDKVSANCSKITTRAYSTSFSLGIYFLGRSLHEAVYGIYGFVRVADEIVDSFHGYDKETLLKEFRESTTQAIERGISLNPILNSFQHAVNTYHIEWELIDTFLKSMEMDLAQTQHDAQSYSQYILGSAEVVGLMCLRVFTGGNHELYHALKPSAMKLGAAFQKVNFLRDLKDDYHTLGRTYFPEVNFNRFSQADKDLIEADIDADFKEALSGIKRLPNSSRLGVYVAYVYYHKLFLKIKNTPAEEVMEMRIRIPDMHKFALLCQSFIRHKLNRI